MGGGFVEPERDGRGTFGGSRRERTVRASAGPACVSVGRTPRETRVSTRGRGRLSREPRHRRHVFRFFQQKMRYLCMRIQSHETELSEWSSVHFFRMPARTFLHFPEVPSSTPALRGGARRILSCDVADRSVARAPARVTLAPARAGQGRAVDRRRSSPASAVSRRCSCSGSPRSPSRA